MVASSELMLTFRAPALGSSSPQMGGIRILATHCTPSSKRSRRTMLCRPTAYPLQTTQEMPLRRREAYAHRASSRVYLRNCTMRSAYSKSYSLPFVHAALPTASVFVMFF